MADLGGMLRGALEDRQGETLIESHGQAGALDRVTGADLGLYVEEVRGYFGDRPGPVLFAATGGIPARALYLALLAAGITAAPVHASTPARRLRAIAETCGAETLVVPPPEGGPVSPAQLEQVGIADAGGSRRSADRGEVPAYILHTSGSTGRPKGVPIHASALESYLGFVIDHFAWRPGSRFSATFDLAFDLALHDLLVPVLTRGISCLVPPRMTLLPKFYAARCGLDQWFSVPGIASIARRTGGLPAGSLARLERSLFCGEALVRADAEYWAEATGRPVHNLYGPTEMTLAATMYEFTGESHPTVPIGRPFAHLEARQGSSRHPAELILRGPQMFAGYLDPSDDDDAFEVDGAGRRWYRTGDLVEQVPEGYLFHGRLDTQVKVGGHRVDLMDVELAVRSHPCVQEVVAYVDPQVTRIAVAVVAGSDAGDDAVRSELLQHVARLLPEYMVPGLVSFLDHLPRNGNGKIDRGRTVEDCVRQSSARPGPDRVASEPGGGGADL